MSSDPAKATHVLVVDDEPDFAALLRSILIKAGYTVATASHCEDAMKELNRKTPDLITLDINMPEKSGVFFYRDIKSRPEFRGIPVIVVTGLTRDDKEMENIIRSFLETQNVPHPEAYLEKPVTGSSLRKAVETALLSGKPASC
jgi:CheY-like chemotaxis protein